MSAELLREAAEKMQTDAGGVAHFRSPWRIEPEEDDSGEWVVLYNTDHPLAGLIATTPDYGQIYLPDYIASWHPAVALAVAAWLDREATELERHITEWREGSKDPRNRWAERGMTVESNIEHHYGRAIAVARAYLRRQP